MYDKQKTAWLVNMLRSAADTIEELQKIIDEKMPPQIKDDSLLSKSPIELRMSVKVCNILESNPPISTIGELINCTEQDLLDRRGCGVHALNSIKESLARYGLKLKTL